MRSHTKLLASLLLAGLVVIQVASAVVLWRDQRYLSRLLDQVADRSLPPSEQAFRVVAFLRDKPYHHNDSYLFFPFLRLLRATPRQVAEDGGDCADRSRLLMVLLQIRGIPASKWALYTPDGRPVHAVVEVELEKGKMVVDPLFGLWFPRPEGGYYGIRELKQQPEILRKRIETLISLGERPGRVNLTKYPMNRYVYTYARSINWQKFRGMSVAYSLLRVFLGNKADEIYRPRFMEQPALVILTTLGLMEAIILFILFWGRRRHKAKFARASPFTVFWGSGPRVAGTR